MSTHSPARDPTRRTVRLLNAVAFSRGLIFLIPVIVPYFADHVGLGFRDFLASEAVFAATMVAMEVPSGWLGDVWGRKRVIVLGGLVAALGAALFLPADSFLDAAVAQALVGVGIALYSGADSALLYDCLAAHGREGRFRRLEGRRHGLGLYAVALSSVVGAGLYAIDPAWPVWGMVAAYLATAGFALAIVEPPRVRQARRWATPDLRSLWASHRGVLAVIAAGAVLFAATSVGMWSQQPYYAHLGIGERWFGLLMAAGYLAGGLAGQFGHLLDRRLGPAGALAGLWAVLAAAYGVTGLLPGYHGVVLLLVGSVVWGAGWPLVQTAINRRISSARRATVLSAAALAIKLTFIPLSAAAGWLAEGHGITVAIAGLAGFLAVVGLAGALSLWRAPTSPANTNGPGYWPFSPR